MGDILLILLGCLGTTWIIKYGSILNPIRNYLQQWEFTRKLLVCAMCSGWWVGLFWQFFLDKPIWVHLMLPFISSAFCYAADNVLATLNNLSALITNCTGLLGYIKDEISSEVQKEP
jgi:hypothetical protein